MPDHDIPHADFWKRKLAAFLHDPPEKAYDFGPYHHRRAETHADSFRVTDLWRHLTSHPDWSAAAADRFIFPGGQKLGSNLGEETRPCFIHPVSGRKPASPPALPTDKLAYPSQADAEEWLGDIRPDWLSDDPQTLFLRAWRNWSAYAAQHPKGKNKGAELLPYLPADTRIADGSIWHHCAVVSALEATRQSDDPGAPLRPAFLLFQVGPVQEFIAQARSTRDLWSGSYLLSWLTMHAIKAVADRCGPDAVIFPSLKGQPLYDFLERRLDLRPDDDDVLVPGIPNRFLALVPQGFDVEAIVNGAFHKEWQAIAATCQQWLQERGLPFDAHHASLWNRQIETHWQFTWQIWPWQSASDALAAFQSIPLGHANPIHLGKDVAHAIPDAHKDERCYRGGPLDPGWAWSAHYQLCQHALDARRSVRDFAGLPTDLTRKPGHRDALSGREEAAVQAVALEDAVKKNDALRHIFRHIEPLGAANLVKRVWHRAYLDRLNQIETKGHLPPLQRARESFDSVPSVAAGGWLHRLKQRLGEEQNLWIALVEVSEKLAAASRHLRGVTIPAAIGKSARSDENRWLDRIEAEIYTERFWNQIETETRSQPEVTQAAAAIRDFKKRFKLGEPPAYCAVLALDGDHVGKWLSGEKSPAVQNVISRKAAGYFREHLPGAGVKKWLESPRPLSPSWHLQFSEALANFGLHAARRIVEEVHHGQLIYSGGDDVLAMAPADEAIACALDLRAAFRGLHVDMSPECGKLFRPDAPEGFLWLADPRETEPTWPLLVPGPRMTVSVGLAIGHVKEPLQDMIGEAQAAEKRAKADPETEIFDRSNSDPAKHGLQWRTNEGWGRDALAVTLYKRSGETIRWGARFDSPAFGLLRDFQSHYRAPWDQPGAETPISGKFPYRLAELLGHYGDNSETNDDLHDIALKEFEWAATRQIQKQKTGPVSSDAALEELRQNLRAKAAAYLAHLRDFTWDRPTSNSAEELVSAPRPLSEFVDLFLIEAFIRRQAD